MTRARRLLAAVGACGLLIISAARADMISIDKPYELYGHIWNTEDGTKTGTPKPWCAPTATMNSFVYLQNKYPAIYDKKLTGDDPVAARNALRDMMGGCAAGALPDQWWNGKVKYIEEKAPGSTIFHGMSWWDPREPGKEWYYNKPVTKGAPSWTFLWEQMKKCEDVEIGIYWADGAHALTLTSLKVDDKDGDGTWDPGDEAAWLDYIDPNNPIQKFESALGLDADKCLTFSWHNGGANEARSVWIGVAFAESPVPAPGAMVLVLVGVGMVGWAKRSEGRNEQ